MFDLKNLEIKKRKTISKKINLEKCIFLLKIYASKISGPGIFDVIFLKNNKAIYNFQFISQSSSQFFKNIIKNPKLNAHKKSKAIR